MSEPRKVKILIVEDQFITRAGLKLILERESEFSVIGESDDGPSAVEMSVQLKPDVILMDIFLPGIDGIEVTRQIKQAMPDARVLMLTSCERDDDVFAALAAGADGYCLKTVSSEQLVLAIRSVSEGAAWLDAGIAKRVLKASAAVPAPVPSGKAQQNLKFPLSQRELEVLQVLVEGKSNLEIAAHLVVSPETVKTHMRHIMEKLMVSDRTQAAIVALRQRLV